MLYSVKNLVCYARHAVEKAILASNLLKPTNEPELQYPLRTSPGKASPILICLKIKSVLDKSSVIYKAYKETVQITGQAAELILYVKTSVSV